MIERDEQSVHIFLHPFQNISSEQQTSKIGRLHKTLTLDLSHRKILKDTIRGITKPDIRRLARRGGVKRMSAAIYEETRVVLRARLELILSQLVTICSKSMKLLSADRVTWNAIYSCQHLLAHMNRKTVTVVDVSYPPFFPSAPLESEDEY